MCPAIISMYSLSSHYQNFTSLYKIAEITPQDTRKSKAPSSCKHTHTSSSLYFENILGK